MFSAFSADLVGHDRAVDAAVLGDLRDGRRQGAVDDVHADLLVAAGRAAGLLDRRPATQQGHAAARQDAFFRRRAGGVQGVLDAGLGLLHLGLGAAAHRDHRHAAGQLGQPLLELLAVVVAVGRLDLPLELLDAGLDVGLLAGRPRRSWWCPCRR